MAKNQTIYRTVKNRENPYVMIDKNIFTDTRLSWKAKGLLGYFLSRPDNWTIRIDDLIKQSKDGRDSVYSGLRELKKCGYIVQVAYRLKNGRIDHFEHHVYEQPLDNPPDGIVYIDMEEESEEPAEEQPLPENPEMVEPLPEKPLPENPYMENPYTENPTLLNNESTNNGKRINNDIDDDGSATSKPWENDFDYLAFRKRFVDAGADDIKDHSKHYERFKEAVATIGFSKLLQFTEQYIAENKEASQICWFLGGGWKNYLPKKTTKKAVGQAGKLPKAVAEQLKAEEEQAAGSAMSRTTLSEEELAERRARLQAKMKYMDETLSANLKPEDPFAKPFHN